MASAVAREYNEDLGAEPPEGASGRALVKGSGSEALLKRENLFAKPT